MEHRFQAVVSEWKKSNLEWALMGMGKGIRRERHYRPLRQLKLALLMRQEETYVWACQQWAAVEGALTVFPREARGKEMGFGSSGCSWQSTA